MSMFSNIVNAIFYNGKSVSTEVFGFSKYGHKRQSDKKYPFEEAFIKSSDVYSINSRISNSAKGLELELIEVRGDSEQVITSGEVYDLWVDPNKNITRSEFIGLGMLYLTIGGNVYFNPLKPLGFSKASQVEYLHPQYTEIKTKYVGRYNELLKYVYRVNGKEFNILPEDIYHLKYANPTNYGFDSLYGLSPLVAGYLTTEHLINNDDAGANILKNQGAAGILTNETDRPLNQDQQKQQQKLLDRKLAGANKFGKIIQSMAKVRYLKLGLDPTQLKIIESKVMKMRDLCNIYSTPSQLLNDSANKTYNTQKEAEKAFMTEAVIKNLEFYLKGYDRVTVEPYKTDRVRYYTRIDKSSIEVLQSDKKLEAEKDKIEMEGIEKILNMNTSPEGKKYLLMDKYDISEENANLLVNI